MHTALYREFRPATFDELIGQDHIVRILKNQIRSGSTSHAYLFSGTRGTGKTTTARILAKALNCTGEGEKPCCTCDSCRAITEGSFVDVIEMDAASHRGVNEIQEITDAVMYAPAAGRYKVYIIDEVHMLSTEAFNALLKTLEEPPAHVVFILATTEPQKVPATILSRVMKLDFRRVPEKKLIENMKAICESRQIEAEDAALSLIAVNADGSVRDSLSILEQCICPGDVLRRDDVAEILGTSGVEPLLHITDLILDQNPSGALLLLEDILNAGVETGRFMKEWLGHFRNLLIAGYVDNPEDLLNMSGENAARLTEQSKRISQQLLEKAIKELTETISLTRWARYPRVMLEMTIVKLASPQTEFVQMPPNSNATASAGRSASQAGTSAGSSSRSNARAASSQKKAMPAKAAPVQAESAVSMASVPIAAPEQKAPPAQDYFSNAPGQRYEQQPASSRNPGMLDGMIPDDRVPDNGMQGRMITDDRMPDDGIPGGMIPNDRIPDYIMPDEDYQDYGIQGGAFPETAGMDYRAPGGAASENRTPDHAMPESGRTNAVPAKKSADSAAPQNQMTPEIWKWVVDEASRKKGLFIRLTSRTSYLQTKENQVVIACDDEATRTLLAGKAKDTVEQLLQQAVGSRMRVVPMLRSEGGSARKEDQAQKKEKLDAFFGMDVDFR